MNGFRRLRPSAARWPSRHRLVHVTMGGLALAVYQLTWDLYNWAPQGAFDFPIVDAAGSALGTIAAGFLLVGIFGRGGIHDIFLIRLAMIGVLLYELFHPILGSAIDPWDVLAAGLAGWGSERLYRLLHPGVASPLIVAIPAEAP